MIRAEVGIVDHVHCVTVMASTCRRSITEDHLASRMRRSQLANELQPAVILGTLTLKLGSDADSVINAYNIDFSVVAVLLV
jgi:hypothetical protein